MRLVVALGGNALLRRSQPPSASNQLENVRIAAAQLARVATAHDVLLTHGNGPQVGLLALQAAAYTTVEAIRWTCWTQKVEAACAFVRATGRRAAIGALDSIEALLAGDAGTQVSAGPT